MGGLRRLGSLPGDLLTRIATAEQTALTADAKAANARQMVLTRDPRLDAVERTASSLPTTLAQAAAEHTAINARIDQINAALDARTKALEAAVATLTGLKVRVGFGSKTISGSLLAGGTTTAVVTLDKDMGSTDYSVGYSFEGGTGLLGSIAPTGVTAKTTTTVTVQLKNTGLVTVGNLAGGVVHVVAARSA